MFYHNTKWAERSAARTTAMYQPGTARRYLPERPGRDDFESGLEYLWYYVHYSINTFSVILPVIIIIINIGLATNSHCTSRQCAGRGSASIPFDPRALAASLVPVSTQPQEFVCYEARDGSSHRSLSERLHLGVHGSRRL